MRKQSDTSDGKWGKWARRLYRYYSYIKKIIMALAQSLTRPLTRPLTSSVSGGDLVLVYASDDSHSDWEAFGDGSKVVLNPNQMQVSSGVDGEGVRMNAFLPTAGERYRFIFDVLDGSILLRGATSWRLLGNANNIVASVTDGDVYIVDLTVDAGGWGDYIYLTINGTPSPDAFIAIRPLKIYKYV